MTPRSSLLSVVVALSLSAIAHAQLPQPQLSTIFPPGAQAGSTVEVTISGTELEECQDLVFSHPGIACAQIPIAATEFKPASHHANRYKVTVAADVPPGHYEVSARTRLGLTPPQGFIISKLKEVVHAANNSTETAMPLELETVVNAHTDNEGIDYYKVSLKADQRVLFRCEADPLDSPLDATMVLEDSNGRELARDRDSVGQDAVLGFTAPADGDYLLKVHDMTFKGGATHLYRLTASSAPHIDFIYPPAGAPDSTGRYRVYGRNLPGGSTGEGVRRGNHELESVEVEITLGTESSRDHVVRHVHTALAEGMEYQLKNGELSSNSVRIGYAKDPIVAEEEGTVLPIAVPCEIHGRFQKRSDLDAYRFEAKKGEAITIRCLSEQLGNQTDPILIIELLSKDKEGKETAKEVASNDDASNSSGGHHFKIHSRDPALNFTPPADGFYRLSVLNQIGKGGGGAIYRLQVQRPQPQFDLVAIPWASYLKDRMVRRTSNIIRAGGSTIVRVLALRRPGFNGDITLTVEGLPDGVHCPPTLLRAGKEFGSLYLSSPVDAKEWHGFVTIKGTHGDVVRTAHSGSIAFNLADYNTAATKSRLTSRLPLSVHAAEKAPIVFEQPAQDRFEVVMGNNLEIPIKLLRHGGAKGDTQINVLGLPYKKGGASAKFNDKTNEGKITIPIKKTGDFDIAPGEWQFVLVATGTVKFQSNLAAVERAKADEQRLIELEKKLLEEAKAAKDLVEAAKKEVTTAEQNFKAASEDAKAELGKILNERKAKLQEATQASNAAEAKAKQATAEKGAATNRVKAATDRAKPKDLPVKPHSRLFTLVVKPAPAPPKAEGK